MSLQTRLEPIHQEIAAALDRVSMTGRGEKATLPADVIDLAIKALNTPEIKAVIRWRVFPAGRNAKTIELYHVDHLPGANARVIPAVAKAVNKVKKGTQQRKSRAVQACAWCSASVDQMNTPQLYRVSGGALRLVSKSEIILCERHALQEFSAGAKVVPLHGA